METAVLLCVPEAEDLVGPWRRKADPSAEAGVPAHVTLLTPFLPAERIDAGVLAELGWFFAGIDASEVQLAQVGAFEDAGVVYLDPVAQRPRRLAAALARRWPETPPYEGRVDAPHAPLTVVHDDDAVLREQAADAWATACRWSRLSRAALWTCDEHGRWSEAHTFDFGATERP